MRSDRPSFTAAYVALCRGLGEHLPSDVRVSEDPFGLAFTGRVGPAVVALSKLLGPAAMRRAAELDPALLWVQLRTRWLDDVLLEAVEDGARQIVLLGAGFDCRAARLVDRASGATFFEVDHPATMRKKREVLGAARSAPVAYVPWDFEARAMETLPDALAEAGLDRSARALTIWEGVTMYLSEPAIDASVRAVRAYSGPGSELAFTYFDRAKVERPPLWMRLLRRTGEPARFGWHPHELATWLEKRDFTLERDVDDEAYAREILTSWKDRRPGDGARHLALARVA